jgi:glutamate-ammonia-ligase adenylyltransferase
LAAAEQVWSRPFGAEELRQLRHMKSRTETELIRRNLAEREIKRGPGGIRDIEFAVQLLQLVHGRSDESLRVPATLDALRSLAAGGYVSGEDADSLASAYRFLRTVEHRLQLYEGQAVHMLPAGTDRRDHLAIVMGYRPDGRRSAEQRFEADLRAHRAAARSIHERLFFRPLLEAFTSGRAAGSWSAAALGEEAAVERLTAFGFADPARTAQAVADLTRGFSRMSQLMQRMLPLLLDWLSASADPDQGLLGLRILAGAPPSRDWLVTVCRESPTAARQLCQLLGSGPRFARDLQHHPESLGSLASGTFPQPRSAAELRAQAAGSLVWRSGEAATELGLRQFARAETLRIAARDVLEMDDTSAVGGALSDLADSVIAAALEYLAPPIPFAVIGMGRLGGREPGYGSDVDLLMVWDAPPGGPGPDEIQTAADAAAVTLTRLIGGESPATGAYRVDLGLRPEGRQGRPARSLAAYAAYYDRWAEPWERQALLRSRFVAGDPAVGAAFAQLVDRFVWTRPVTQSDVVAIRRTKARIERERVPAGEDPKFHLKLGPGSMSDVEWTVQLIQLRCALPEAGTMAALDRLVEAGAVDPEDAAVLADSYRFCERARNRLSLIRDLPGESLPVTGPALTTLARSLGFTASGLRNEYARVTRRARRVMERLFYEA